MKVTMKVMRSLVPNYHYNIPLAWKKLLKLSLLLCLIELTLDIIFPNYLRGCESYYKEHKIGINSRYWVLKDKYRENRPTYDWNITYTVYDIELTDEGKEEVERRYYMHLRNMEKYLRLMD